MQALGLSRLFRIIGRPFPTSYTQQFKAFCLPIATPPPVTARSMRFYVRRKPRKEDKQEEEVEEETVADPPAASEPPPPAPPPSSSKRKAETSKSDPPVSSPKKKSDRTGPSLEETIKQVEQSFGKGTLMKLGAMASTRADVISTGSLGLDIALGVGGLPQGRIIEIYGPESSGKTTLALHVIAEAQKLGKNCTFIDAEHALNPVWAAKLGVDLNELLISQPDSGEQALEITDTLIRSGNMHVIVIDSVAALVPRVELEGEMGDTHIGLQARLMSQALRKISPSITKSNTVLIFINQIRMKIGVMFGSPEVTTGGNALKFYSSVRLDIRRIGSVKRGDDIVGSQIRVKVAKNKLAPPFREALFDIDFGRGISRAGEAIDLGVKAKVIEKAGPWYSYNGSQLGQGREKTKVLLEQQLELADEIEKAIRDRLLAHGEKADEILAGTDEASEEVPEQEEES